MLLKYYDIKKLYDIKTNYKILTKLKRLKVIIEKRISKDKYEINNREYFQDMSNLNLIEFCFKYYVSDEKKIFKKINKNLYKKINKLETSNRLLKEIFAVFVNLSKEPVKDIRNVNKDDIILCFNPTNQLIHI